MTRLDRRSEAQAVAEYGRTATYADESAASWRYQQDRPAREPKSVRGYIHELRDAHEAEVPTRLHRHDVDGGGTPAYTAAFEQYLWGSPHSVDKDTGEYSTPLRSCLAGMARANDERMRARAAIAYAIIVGGVAPSEAVAQHEPGVPAHWCEVIATDVLRVTWRRMSRSPLPMPNRDAVA